MLISCAIKQSLLFNPELKITASVFSSLWYSQNIPSRCQLTKSFYFNYHFNIHGQVLNTQINESKENTSYHLIKPLLLFCCTFYYTALSFTWLAFFVNPQFNWLAVGREMSIKVECILNYNRILHIHKMGSGFYVCMLNLFYTFCAYKNCEWNVMQEQKHIAYGQIFPVCT